MVSIAPCSWNKSSTSSTPSSTNETAPTWIPIDLRRDGDSAAATVDAAGRHPRAPAAATPVPTAMNFRLAIESEEDVVFMVKFGFRLAGFKQRISLLAIV